MHYRKIQNYICLSSEKDEKRKRKEIQIHLAVLGKTIQRKYLSADFEL